MPALSSSWTSSFPFSPWCLLLRCIYRQQFTSPLHFHYAGINMEAVLALWCNQVAPPVCSPWHHFYGGIFLECPQSHLHTPEETLLLQKGIIFPISWEHSSWITFASLFRSLKETPEAVGSSSAVLLSTSHGFLAETFVLDPSIFSV